MKICEKYDPLKLENQLGFPMYVASKEIIRRYTPYLKEIDLTYTQYIAMMVMWEEKEVFVKELGEKLFLDSGTLTPLLKNLEKKGFITRERSKTDERFLVVRITEKGEQLKEKAVEVPHKVEEETTVKEEDLIQLYSLLNKLLKQYVAGELIYDKK